MWIHPSTDHALTKEHNFSLDDTFASCNFFSMNLHEQVERRRGVDGEWRECIMCQTKPSQEGLIGIIRDKHDLFF